MRIKSHAIGRHYQYINMCNAATMRPSGIDAALNLPSEMIWIRRRGEARSGVLRVSLDGPRWIRLNLANAGCRPEIGGPVEWLQLEIEPHELLARAPDARVPL